MSARTPLPRYNRPLVVALGKADGTTGAHSLCGNGAVSRWLRSTILIRRTVAAIFQRDFNGPAVVPPSFGASRLTILAVKNPETVKTTFSPFPFVYLYLAIQAVENPASVKFVSIPFPFVYLSAITAVPNSLPGSRTIFMPSFVVIILVYRRAIDLDCAIRRDDNFVVVSILVYFG